MPADLADAFAFAAGQYADRPPRRGTALVLDLRPGRVAPPRIGVREVAGGAVSGWLVHDAQGRRHRSRSRRRAARFTPDLTVPGRHVLIAAGSGITPMMSIAASVLAADDKSTVTLLYGNRRSDTVMFADEVADLKDAYPARMQIVHVLSREPQEVELHSGRLDARAADRAAARRPSTSPAWTTGGCAARFGMVTDAIEVLRGLGVDAGRIHRELFWVGDEPPAEATHEDAPVGAGASVTVILDGRSTTLTLPAGHPGPRRRPAGPARPAVRLQGRRLRHLPGARSTRGAAAMRRNYALEQHETDAGYVLTCQAVPPDDEITVDYDA